MTKAAKTFGKRLDNFWIAKDTTPYIAALKCSLGIRELSQAIGGWHGNPQTGTWAHPKLAVFFARWLDVRFAVWCDAMIDDILKGKASKGSPKNAANLSEGIHGSGAAMVPPTRPPEDSPRAPKRSRKGLPLGAPQALR